MVVRVLIRARDLPGRTFAQHSNVHVALQVGDDPVEPLPRDAASASWETQVSVVDGRLRAPAVHGPRGDRFLYLTWGSPSEHNGWSMFRRAKLMLDHVELGTLGPAEGRGLVADVSLTDAKGEPRCARIVPPAVTWSIG